ncbi:MAG: heavy-metal-associated domain-containing protein [Bacteroidetes bacterium]|nr:heavy-metal-associated domain-containing protein [Bacteroidota bacterium]
MNISKYIIVIGVVLASCNGAKDEKNTSEKTTTEVTTKVENDISTSSFKVWGNCEMCKETIEGSLKVDGVEKADWDVDSKIMTVSYNASKISIDQIFKNISSVGYDNIALRGNDSAYKELPECCQYDRKK